MSETYIPMSWTASNGKTYYAGDIIPQGDYDQFTEWEKENMVKVVEEESS
jgi:hypothetical protein